MDAGDGVDSLAASLLQFCIYLVEDNYIIAHSATIGKPIFPHTSVSGGEVKICSMGVRRLLNSGKYYIITKFQNAGGTPQNDN